MKYPWDDHKETLRRLYLGEGKTIEEVMKEMIGIYGFTARYAIAL
jgi:hypothetical protein